MWPTFKGLVGSEIAGSTSLPISVATSDDLIVYKFGSLLHCSVWGHPEPSVVEHRSCARVILWTT